MPKFVCTAAQTRHYAGQCPSFTLNPGDTIDLPVDPDEATLQLVPDPAPAAVPTDAPAAKPASTKE